MYVYMLTFFAGWFGGYWWRGMEYDAPNPHDPQPWLSLVLGVIAGAAAVLVLDVAAPRMDSAAAAGRGGMDAVAGVLLAIAVGRVAVGIVAPIMRRSVR
jgi:hypothetical protein